MLNDSHFITMIIADGENTTGEIELPETYYIAGIIYPAMTTSTAFNFEVSHDKNTYKDLYGTDGTIYAITIPLATAGAVTLPPHIFYPWESAKIKVADNQTGDKTLLIMIRNY